MTGCSQKLFNKTKHTSEARHKATMKSYKVLGKRYYPSYVSMGQVQNGISSWYGPNFHGKYTSNGEVYNMHARTAAHKTWPMDTMVRVSNLENGKSTVVRINDRGPFVEGRIIDCSYTAGKEIGLDKMGIAKVKVEVVGFVGKRHTAKTIVKKKKTYIKKQDNLSTFGIQVGSFSYYEGAKKYKQHYARKYPNYRLIIKRIPNEEGIMTFRVWLMGFSSEAEARHFKENNDLYGMFIVRN
jgi:rare lipoprotein A